MLLRKLFLFSIFICFAYSNEAILLTQDEKNYLKEKEEISICFSPKGLPLLGYKEGENIGILPEIMSLVEKNIPIPFRYVSVKTWKECIELSKEKKVDMAAQIYAASMLAIEVDTAAEQKYMQNLALGLGLDAQVVAYIDRTMGIKKA